MRAGRSETSKDWMAPIPDSPSISFFQTRSTPRPSGVTSPIPVTTTRLMPAYPNIDKPETRSAVSLDKADGVFDGDDLLRGVVRNLAAEFLLERHHQLDRIEAVRSQVVDEAGVLGHLRLLDAEMLDDDFLHSIGDITHPYCPSMADSRCSRLSAARLSNKGDQPLYLAPARPRWKRHITRIRRACQSGEPPSRDRLYHDHAAVDMDGLTSHVGRLRARQINHCAGDFFRRAEAFHGDRGGAADALIVGKFVGHRSGDEPRCDTVDGDAASRDLGGDRFRHADHSGFRRGIIRLPRIAR